MKATTERELIQDYLRECYCCSVVATYRDISALIGFEIQGRKRYLLSAAIDFLKQEKKIFASVPSLGYRPLSLSEDKMTYIEQGLAKIARLTDRVCQSFDAVELANLSKDQLDKFNQLEILASMHRCLASEDALKVASGFRVERHITASSNSTALALGRKALAVFAQTI